MTKQWESLWAFIRSLPPRTATVWLPRALWFRLAALVAQELRLADGLPDGPVVILNGVIFVPVPKSETARRAA